MKKNKARKGDRKFQCRKKGYREAAVIGWVVREALNGKLISE